MKPAPAGDPRPNEQLRLTLGSKRLPRAKAIEARLIRPRTGALEQRAREDERDAALKEMRQGLDIIRRAMDSLGAAAWEDLPTAVTLTSRRGKQYEARFITPGELHGLERVLDFWLGPRLAAQRPKDEKRVRIGIMLERLFREHGERMTLGRFGLFSETLAIVLEACGHRAPADRLRLLRDIRSASRR